MKKTLLAIPLAIGIAANAEAGILSWLRQYFAGNTDLKSRIINTAKSGMCETGISYVKDQKYEEAIDMFLKAIEQEPKNSERYKLAGEWLTKKIWMHIVQNNPKAKETELAVARIYCQKAEKLARITPMNPLKQEYLDKAYSALEKAIEIESETKEALDRMKQ